ncbi:MAG TPA: NADH-quinone oxidoreductase subunit M [Bryobacteraceae bacterium]|nr:NADH-quinone oxidoreductase subunit M [Bryobacteraceae bacterium]
MILFWLILIPFVAGILAWIVARRNATAARVLSLAALALDLTLALGLWVRHPIVLSQQLRFGWFASLTWDWIPQFGIRFHLAVDGLALVMIVLTAFLGIVAVLASWSEIQNGVGFFHFNLLWVISGVTGVFLAADLFLFYLFWELMLVPMYFLIAIWGYERKTYAAIKFFLFTQISSLLMLVAIISLAVAHYHATGVYSFAYEDLLGTPLSPATAMLMMLGFFAAFAVKLPAFPLHTWLPDAHTEAPTAGSVLLAGLLLKTGAFGMLRFVLPLFPGPSRELGMLMMAVGVTGILYGAILAFAQSDLKRMVAYTSVSHMGFVLLGIFSGNELALDGALVQMVSHGISTGALFVLAGALKDRLHTRELDSMGGLWDTMPVLSGSGMVFAMASVGLPGLGDFVGEFMVLVGTYRTSPVLAILAALGMIAGVTYGLRMIQRALLGPNTHNWKLPDARWYERVVFGSMIVGLLWIGLYPQPVLKLVRPAIGRISQQAIQTLAMR